MMEITGPSRFELDNAKGEGGQAETVHRTMEEIRRVIQHLKDEFDMTIWLAVVRRREGISGRLRRVSIVVDFSNLAPG